MKAIFRIFILCMAFIIILSSSSTARELVQNGASSNDGRVCPFPWLSCRRSHNPPPIRSAPPPPPLPQPPPPPQKCEYYQKCYGPPPPDPDDPWTACPYFRKCYDVPPAPAS
ncbi:hypothetical protein RJ641_006576 [Dillenia turbinata]|uniref:Uncharacterized protein n=1 Tax=Dillenia turbinata TaxID=194707 RepID=A0AAN8V5N4_9MAGN